MKQLREFNAASFAKDVNNHRVLTLGIGLRQAAIQVGVSAATLCRIENEAASEINNIISICDWMDKPIERFIKTKK